MRPRTLTVRFPADKDKAAFLRHMLQERKERTPMTPEASKVLIDALEKGTEDQTIQAAIDAATSGWTVVNGEAWAQQLVADSVCVNPAMITFEWMNGSPSLETELWILGNLARFDEAQAREFLPSLAGGTATVDPYAVAPAA
jgi:hypothetical protein